MNLFKSILIWRFLPFLPLLSAAAEPSLSPNLSMPDPGFTARKPGRQLPKKKLVEKEDTSTSSLPQFKKTIQFIPKGPNYRVSFSLEEADLPELVRVISNLTGKKFIFGGKLRNIKATVYAPQKITVAEAYKTFLSILETNGLTVIPDVNDPNLLKIVESSNAASQPMPISLPSDVMIGGDQYITRLHRLSRTSAEEVAHLLGHFKSKDADITVYAPGNLLIITDLASNIQRMMKIIEEIDVGSAGDQVWIEPIHYGLASDVATRINEVFDLKAAGGAVSKSISNGTVSSVGAADIHIAKVVADVRTNSLLIVATERAYLQILEFLKRLDIPETEGGEIHVVPLQHADATDLVKTIQEIMSGTGESSGSSSSSSSSRGGNPITNVFERAVKVSADKATNSLIVTSSNHDYASLRLVIDRLDQRRKQVFIEAVIMDLAIERFDKLGFNYHFGDAVGKSNNANDNTLIAGGLNPVKTLGPLVSMLGGDLQGAALGVRGPQIPNTNGLIAPGISIPAFGAIITALATAGDSDTLSTPHILATDNVPAEISVGENVPLQQASGMSLPLPTAGGLNPATAGGLAAAGLAGLSSFGGFGFTPPRQDVGVKIKITPHLNESNEVRLELSEEISDAKAPEGTLQVVPLTKRTATTQLVVRDQETVVIAGLMRNRILKSRSKIPILGDIPLLGALFRNSENRTSKSNLVLVLTPYIIRDQNDLRTVFERKMQERQELLDHYFVFRGSDYQPPKDYSRTNGVVEEIRQSYMEIEEKRKLDELGKKPGKPKTHSPGQPLGVAPLSSPSEGSAPHLQKKNVGLSSEDKEN
ncbi:type II secretion system secretin GspD [Pajaroellobacter abortibovis]|uniref:Type II secretion system protein GspD n=1 Tax=Pajaroellobacter abortibovis TaxID=1882918 RepID=A0A1L6MWU9_9BACT|nr:type II secretion system secretin GspD [Pajaroellobacter abortibovis]APS00017.1 type II secretion system protein GspD [Pajaroellobacter abortibovis]